MFVEVGQCSLCPVVGLGVKCRLNKPCLLAVRFHSSTVSKAGTFHNPSSCFMDMVYGDNYKGSKLDIFHAVHFFFCLRSSSCIFIYWYSRYWSKLCPFLSCNSVTRSSYLSKLLSSHSTPWPWPWILILLHDFSPNSGFTSPLSYELLVVAGDFPSSSSFVPSR